MASVGMGAVELIPRRILALYNGADQRDLGPYGDVAYAAVHRTGAVVQEHLGYAVDYVDVRGPLPGGSLANRYAGIVTWFTDEQVPNQESFQAWLLVHGVNGPAQARVAQHLHPAGGFATAAFNPAPHN